MHIKSSSNINSFKKEERVVYYYYSVDIQKNNAVCHKNEKSLFSCIHTENTSNMYIVHFMSKVWKTEDFFF